MTRNNVPVLTNNCFSLDGLTRCDTLLETIVEQIIGDIDNSATAVMLRSSGTLIADPCSSKRIGDTLYIPVSSPQFVRSLDFFESKTPFSGVAEAENGSMKVKANATSKVLTISGYALKEGIAAKQTLFYLTQPVNNDLKMPNFTTDKVLVNGQLATFKVTDEGCSAQKTSLVTLQVYPNPTTDFIAVNYTVGVKGQLSLTDAIGRQMMVKQTDGSGQVTLDLSEFAVGVYALKLNGSVQKLVKN